MSIAVEEADESQFWFEMIEGIDVVCDQNELKRLLNEANEIFKNASQYHAVYLSPCTE